MRIINFKPLIYSVNSLNNKCEILKFGDSIKLTFFLYAHDNIKGNLPTTLCAGITLFTHRLLEIKKVTNIPTIRTKTNSIKSKSVNTWNDLNKFFIKNLLIKKEIIVNL